MPAQQRPTQVEDWAYLSLDLVASRTFWAVAKLRRSGALSPDLTAEAAMKLHWSKYLRSAPGMQCLLPARRWYQRKDAACLGTKRRDGVASGRWRGDWTVDGPCSGRALLLAVKGDNSFRVPLLRRQIVVSLPRRVGVRLSRELVLLRRSSFVEQEVVLLLRRDLVCSRLPARSLPAKTFFRRSKDSKMQLLK